MRVMLPWFPVQGYYVPDQHVEYGDVSPGYLGSEVGNVSVCLGEGRCVCVCAACCVLVCTFVNVCECMRCKKFQNNTL